MMGQSVLVESAEDMCRLLQSACPAEAVDFARAQHERACGLYDDQKVEFWQDVVALLSADRDRGRAAAHDLRKAHRPLEQDVGAAVAIADARRVA